MEAQSGEVKDANFQAEFAAGASAREGPMRMQSAENGGGASPSETDDQHAQRACELARLIETELIPRMLIAHQVASGESLARMEALRAQSAAAFDLDLFVALSLDADGEALERQSVALLGAGAPLECVYLELLAPAARRLGELWEQDIISFLDVTIALGRLQRTLHALKSEAPLQQDRSGGAGRSILVAAAPGEEHTFGVSMLAGLFARAGWSSAFEVGASSRDLVRAVQQEHFDIVAISASDVSIGRLSSLILALRRGSRNRRLLVLVGGRPFVETPELALRLGADATAEDAVSAVRVAEKLLDLAAHVD